VSRQGAVRGRQRVVVASRNRGKAGEIAGILGDEGLDLEVVSLAGFPEVELPPETGETFAENAVAKVRWVAGAVGCAAVGDDSGLEVDALGGTPGIFSARFGTSGTDEGRYRKVLGLLREEPAARRHARFRCAAAYATPGSEVLVAEGTCEGTIALQPAGCGGFGYDPIFVPEGETRTMAQLTPEEKHAISHRGRAFRELAKLIRKHLGAGGAGSG